ncbi:MAG: glycosyltransferase [Gemmatimonadaceae bacterium]
MRPSNSVDRLTQQNPMPADTRPSGRVLFVTHNVPRYSGDAAGSFVLRLAVALRDAGMSVDILAPGSETQSGTDVIEGIQIERVRYAAPHRMTLAYSGRMAEDVKAGWGARLALTGLLFHLRQRVRARIRQAVREGKPYDIVHAHWWFPSGLAAWSAGVGTSLPVPMVITMHGSDVRLAQSVGASHGIMRRVLMRARVVTAVSRWLAEAAMRIVPDANVRVGGMPVDTRVFVPPTGGVSRLGVLFVGRLNAQKGVANLLDAFARIPDTNVPLNIVGDGPDDYLLKAKAIALGIAHRVTWYGALKQPELVPLYQNTAVVAMPSREEGLGLVAVEAQLCGSPVVAYNSGGLPDVVRPEAGGTLVEAGNIDALSAALSQFSSDTPESNARAHASGAAARAAMLSAFSPEAVAARYIALYNEARA